MFQRFDYNRRLFLVGIAVALGIAMITRDAPAGDAATGNPMVIHVTSKTSLLHLGSLDSFDVTENGKRAGRHVLDGLENKAKMPESARAALDVYRQIVPKENFGGEYTALEWFCDYFLASPEEQQKLVADRYTAAFFHFFADNNFAVLREYLIRKYHLAILGDEQTPRGHGRERFLEDFILFNNPRRERWEKTSKIIEVLNLKPGERVIDIGSGPGYYSFKFAALVGEQGRVYAVDTNAHHTRFIQQMIQDLGIKNIVPIRGLSDDIRVHDNRIDCVFLCSLYHVIYAASTETEREDLIASVKRCLKPDGRLVIVDNAPVEDQTLPYHGPYIAKELVIAQLKHHGFRLDSAHQFLPQRYILVFKQDPRIAPQTGPFVSVRGTDGLQIETRDSLIYLPSELVLEKTAEGREAARLLLDALEKKDAATARRGAELYGKLAARSKVGDEYTAFQWLCEYLAASPDMQKKILADRYAAEYFQLISQDDFKNFRKYVTTLYLSDLNPSSRRDEDELEKQESAHPDDMTQDQIAFWRDYILFNNPRREAWEKTNRMVEFLRLQPGQVVADVGSGPGYYTFKFSDLVGKGGHVFAVDTNAEHLKYVSLISARYGMENVSTIHSALDDTKLPANTVDLVFLCSLYHMVYATSMEVVKDRFIDSIKRSLRKGGRLVIADNALVRRDELSYHGPHIAKELIVLQLKHYGFKLVDAAQFIPQRYVLVFQLDE